jgi:hemoglobin-like flavoprotein
LKRFNQPKSVRPLLPIQFPGRTTKVKSNTNNATLLDAFYLRLFSLTPDFRPASERENDAGQKQAILFLAAHKAARNCGERESSRLA